MENRIRRYIEDLFAPAPKTQRAHDLMEEMILNVIERYHDLKNSGMGEEEAYKSAVGGIGDISELLASLKSDAPHAAYAPQGGYAQQAPYSAPQGGYAPPPSQPAKKGLSTGAIIAIVICGTILLLTIIGAIIGISTMKTILGGDGLVAGIIDKGIDEGFNGSYVFGGDDTGFDNAYSATNEYSVPVEKVKSVSIEWVTGSVKLLTEADSNEVRFTESGVDISEDYALRYKLDEGTGRLSVRFCRTREWMGIDFGSVNLNNVIPPKDLVMYIPDSLMEEGMTLLNLEGVSAKLEVYDIRADKASISTVSGDALIKGVDAGTLDVETVSGEAVVEDCQANKLNSDAVSGSIAASGTFGEVDMQSVSGSLGLSPALLPSDADFETVSGNVELSMPAGTSFTIEFDTASGDMSSYTPSRTAGDSYTFGEAPTVTIDVDTVSGDLTVK